MYIKLWMFFVIFFEIVMIVAGRITRFYDLKVARCGDNAPKFSIMPSSSNGERLAVPLISAASTEMMVILIFFAVESASDLVTACNGSILLSLAILFIGTVSFWIVLWLSAVFSGIHRDKRVAALIGTEKGDEIIAKVREFPNGELTQFLKEEIESDVSVERRFPIQNYYF